MKVLVSKVILIIPYSSSLKEKRRVLKALKDRIWSKFRASISEVAEHNSYRKAVLGLTFVSNEKVMLESIMSKIVEFIEASFPGLLHDYEYIIENY